MAPAALLTDAWLAECNAALASLPGRPEHDRVVLTELVEGTRPPQHPAITLVADATGVRLEPGADDESSATLSVSLEDAEALQSGSLRPADALAEGRVRVRGDLRAVVEGIELLAAASALLRARRGSD